MKTDTFSSEHYVVAWNYMLLVPFEKRAFRDYNEALKLYDTMIGTKGLRIDRLRVITQVETVFP